MTLNNTYESLLSNVETTLNNIDIACDPLSRFGVSAILLDDMFVKYVNEYIDFHKLLLQTQTMDRDYWLDKLYVTQLSHGDHNHILGLMISEQAEIFIRFVRYICNKLLYKQEFVSNLKLDLSDILKTTSAPEIRVYKFTNGGWSGPTYNVLVNNEAGGQIQIQYENNLE